MVDLYLCANSSDFSADEMKGENRHVGLDTSYYVAPVSKSPNTHLGIASTHMKRRKRNVYINLRNKNSCACVWVHMWYVCACVHVLTYVEWETEIVPSSFSQQVWAFHLFLSPYFLSNHVHFHIWTILLTNSWLQHTQNPIISNYLLATFLSQTPHA